MSLWPDDSEDEYVPIPQRSSDDEIHEGESDGSSVEPGSAAHDLRLEGARRAAYVSHSSESTSPGSFGDDEEQPRKKRKRRRLSPDFRSAGGAPPFKRVQGPFTQEYLDLLNEDIDDAKEGIIAEPEPDELPGSQIDMVTWSATEKRLFFDALGRLGKDNLPGISSRIGSKSIVEVAHYIRALEEESKERAVKSRDSVIKAEIPAAAEISPQCCLALEAAADELSLRQQRYEESREQRKWGDTPWKITHETAAELEGKPEDQREPFANLFNLPMWVKLSERVFMNASFAENNWRYVDDERPSMRSTAFEDFRNLAVSVTRRIISTALFIASSRIQMKAEADERTRSLVRRRDVVAAVESLGLALDSGQFWAGCARRLKLDVYDDEHEDAEVDEEGGLPVLSFDEVENALGAAEPSRPSAAPLEDDSEPNDEETDEGETTDSPDTDIERAEAELEATEQALDEELRQEVSDDDLREEAQELVLRTALDIRRTQRTVEAVMRRITAERNNEAYADACDEIASAQEERKLWEVLGREPPGELARNVGIDDRKRETASIGDYLGRGDWRESLKYLSQWETVPRSRAA
ncbi:hypothetical protein VUR80DRAFT_5789 [Thermomyces stellatus]